MATQLALLNPPIAPTAMDGKLRSASEVLTYLLAGNATLTIRSLRTGTRYAYKVRRADKLPAKPWHTTWFVSLLNGPENGNDFAYMGTIQFDDRKQHLPMAVARQWHYGRASRMGPTAPSIGAFTWLYGHVQRGILPTSVEVWHTGRCGRCGRKLTVPESIEAGIGPECAEKL
jgi:hypothetical protein